MAIKNYELSIEQSRNIPAFYYPGGEEDIEGLRFIRRDDERPNPTVEFELRDFPGSTLKLTLRPDEPTVQFVDIFANGDISRTKEGVEKILGVKLG